MFDYTKYIKNYTSTKLICYKRDFGKYYINLCVGPYFSDPSIFQEINLYNSVELEIVQTNSERLLESCETERMGINKILNSSGTNGFASFQRVKLDLIEEVEKLIIANLNSSDLLLTDISTADNLIVGPCCRCNLNDKWNSFKNGKWFCYQHCDY